MTQKGYKIFPRADEKKKQESSREEHSARPGGGQKFEDPQQEETRLRGMGRKGRVPVTSTIGEGELDQSNQGPFGLGEKTVQKAVGKR